MWQQSKEFGFYNANVFSTDKDVPADHTFIRNDKEGAIAIPNNDLNEHLAKSQAQFKPDTPKAIYRASALLQNIGLSSNDKGGQYVPIGLNPKGNTVFGDPKLATLDTYEVGNTENEAIFNVLEPAQIFSPKDATKFRSMGVIASDPEYITKLDVLKTDNNLKGFTETVNSSLGRRGNKDSHGTDLSTTELYEQWNNISPGQKSMGLGILGVQGFTFEDGGDLSNKAINKQKIPGVPDLLVSEGLEMLDEGINIYELGNKYHQIANIQESLYAPKSSRDLATTAKSFDLLGYGPEGRAVNVKEDTLKQFGAKIAPNLGIGAVKIPASSPTPQGYEVTYTDNGQKYAIPTAMKMTMVPNTSAATSAASFMYKKWEPLNKEKQKNTYKDLRNTDRESLGNGAVGGNAMLGGLLGMFEKNPYSAGAAMSAEVNKEKPKDKSKTYTAKEIMDFIKGTVGGGHGLTYQKKAAEGKKDSMKPDTLGFSNSTTVDTSNQSTGSKFFGDPLMLTQQQKDSLTGKTKTWNEIMNATLGTLFYGDSDKRPKVSLLENISPNNFSDMSKEGRALLARLGVSNRETSMQLLNQAYTEGRINETMYASSLAYLNATFGNDYNLYEKLMTGADKGIEILGKRNGLSSGVY